MSDSRDRSVGAAVQSGVSAHGRSAVSLFARSTVRALAFVALAGRAAAHSGSLGGSTRATVPAWLVILTGGVVVGASFLFTTLLTDHGAMRSVNWWRVTLPAPTGLRRAAAVALGGLSVGLLVLVVATGIDGPGDATRNFALLFVWVGWWAGYTITTYAVGNTWPLVNPWRALAGLVRRAGRSVGRSAIVARERIAGSRLDGVGAWPAVAGLLALVWLEVVSPVGDRPGVLVAIVVGYTVVTVAGAVRFGDAWFERVDPVSKVFAIYGRVAPIQPTGGKLTGSPATDGAATDGEVAEGGTAADGRLPADRTDEVHADGAGHRADESRGFDLRLPGTALTEDPLPDRPGEAAFVVALLWVTTYDGLVATPTWATTVEPLVTAGVPALLIYVFALLAGFGFFLGVYRLAARKVRESADTYVTGRAIERWFAPSLLPIAAGYHVAHFLGYFAGLAPALATVAGNPFAPPLNTPALVLPGWFGTLKMLFILGGHVLAIWVAHSLSFELFPGVLAAIRSQYPFVVVMVFYTMSSLWVITQPYNPPPFV